MSVSKTIERRKIRRKNPRLHDFLFELYEDIIPDFCEPKAPPKAIKRKRTKQDGGEPFSFDWGHFFPPNASGKTLVRMIKSKALFLE